MVMSIFIIVVCVRRATLGSVPLNMLVFSIIDHISFSLNEIIASVMVIVSAPIHFLKFNVFGC